MRRSPPSDALSRRSVLAGLGTACLAPRFARADDVAVGNVEALDGSAWARRAEARRLALRSAIAIGDSIWTEASSRLTLAFGGGSSISLGPEARLTVDRFVAETGGDLILDAGALVFDRADDLPRTDIEILTVYGLIGVRGTRFFAGPSRGPFAVFVERGTVNLFAAGVHRRIRSGQGVDIATRGAEPGPVVRWGAARIEEAFRSVLG